MRTTAILLLASLLGAQTIVVRHRGVTGPSYLLTEGAEGTGTPPGWTDTGSSVDWDHTAVVLDGTQTLRLWAGEASDTLYDLGSSHNEIWVRFYFRNSQMVTTNGHFIELIDAADALVGRISTDSSGRLVVYHGTTVTTVDSASANTRYGIWMHWKVGSGANGEASVGFSTTATEPTSGNAYASLTNGTSTTGVRKIKLRNNTTTRTYYFDNLLVDDAAIGNF